MQDKGMENIRPQNYVYLPFKKKECSQKILQQVDLCMQHARENIVENKNYQFIAYGKKQLSNLPPLSRVYIIGYGIKFFPDKVENSLSGGSEAISIPTLVERLVYDGFLTSDLVTIKLWFSDYHGNAEKIAEEFKTLCLETYNAKNRFFIDYYPHCDLHFPLLQNEQHKWALNVKTQESERASKIRQSLFFNTESTKYEKISVTCEEISQHLTKPD